MWRITFCFLYTCIKYPIVLGFVIIIHLFQNFCFFLWIFCSHCETALLSCLHSRWCRVYFCNFQQQRWSLTTLTQPFSKWGELKPFCCRVNTSTPFCLLIWQKDGLLSSSCLPTGSDCYLPRRVTCSQSECRQTDFGGLQYRRNMWRQKEAFTIKADWRRLLSDAIGWSLLEEKSYRLPICYLTNGRCAVDRLDTLPRQCRPKLHSNCLTRTEKNIQINSFKILVCVLLSAGL